jgi:GT2 family glycosyltransferase
MGELNSGSKSALITVTYNNVPNLQNFEKAAEYVDYVIVCDNSTDSKVISYLEGYCARKDGFIFLKNNANLGISKAYNKAVAYAQELGVFWLYFFDDDANFDVAWLEVAKRSWLELEQRGEPVGLLAPIVSNDSRYLGSSLGMRGRYSTISSAITSGLFTNVHAFKLCGGYNPDYFVDWADLELCLRVRRSGRLVVRLNEVFVFQSFGRNLNNGSLRNRLINAYIKLSSVFSLRLNKSNTLSTSYSVYSVSRYQDQKKNALWSVEHSGVRNLGFRLILIMIHHIVLPKILRKEVLA